jgi:hypothetical protein
VVVAIRAHKSSHAQQKVKKKKKGPAIETTSQDRKGTQKHERPQHKDTIDRMSPPAGTGQTAASDSQEWDDHGEDPHAIDDDDLLAELDDKLELSGIRERRLEELRNQLSLLD